MTVDVEENVLADSERAILDGMRGQRVAWLSPEGTLDRTTGPLTVDKFEVPRCPYRPAHPEWTGTAADVANHLAAYPDVDAERAVAVTWPHAIGVVLVLR